MTAPRAPRAGAAGWRLTAPGVASRRFPAIDGSDGQPGARGLFCGSARTCQACQGVQDRPDRSWYLGLVPGERAMPLAVIEVELVLE
jgi:hypothetical protein